MKAENLIGRKYRFYGRVQGVNFRYTTLRISDNFKVTGYVKNIEDGSVELLCFGEKTEVEQFIDSVRNHFKENITSLKCEEVEYSENYKKFAIEY